MPQGIKALVFLHLIGFAAYLGAGFAQQRFMRRSAAAGLAPAVRDEYELLAAEILTKIELPALLAQVATGIAFLLLLPDWLRQPWLHVKLTCVAVLLVLSHLEMFNARKIARARASRGDAAADEIAARKKRHATFGAIGTLAVVVLVAMVAYGTG
jgi:putative membrane protein